MTRFALLTTAAALTALCSLAARADVVHCKDGRTVLGAVQAGSNWAPVVVDTIDGPVEIARADVLTVEDARRLEKALARSRTALAKDDLPGRLRLIDWALRKGLFEEALELADDALASAAESGVDQPIPEGLLVLPVAGVHRGETVDRRRAEKLLASIADGARPATGRVALERLADGGESAEVTELLLESLDIRRPALRAGALHVLGRTRPSTALAAILEVMIRDGEAEVRRAAVEALRDRADVQDDRVIHAIVTGLRADDARLRAASMDAAEALHLVRAVGQLVRNLKRAGPSPAPSGYTAITTQESFVQDFDVDVANSAFIANPNIGVLQSGVVLNSKVLDTTSSRSRGLRPGEARRIGGLLSQLTGQDFGADSRRWIEWLQSKKQ